MVLLGPDSLPRWAAGTDGRGAALTLDADGALVVTDDDGRVTWRTHRPAVPGSTLVLQDDGDLVLSAPDGSTVWSSGTGLGAASLDVDGALASRGHLDGPDGHVRLTLTADELALRYDEKVCGTPRCQARGPRCGSAATDASSCSPRTALWGGRS